MTYFILSMIIFAILTFHFYNMIKFRKVAAEFNQKVERLQGIVDEQQTETRTLLTAYLTESQVIRFYDDAASIIKDKDVIQLFAKLAKDEKKHIALLENCLAKKGIQ